MWSFLVVFAVLVALGVAAPAAPAPLNNTKPFILEVNRLQDTDFKQLETKLRAQAKARVGYPYPSYSSCDVDWTFGVDCVEVSMIIANQIEKWTGPSSCGKSSKEDHDPGQSDCLYQLFMVDETFLYAMHQSQDLQHLDLFYMFFDTMSYGCSAWSFSYSADYENDIKDDGRNYCNVFNLVDGCGLSAQPAYSRDTSDNRCTQFTTSECSTY